MKSRVFLGNFWLYWIPFWNSNSWYPRTVVNESCAEVKSNKGFWPEIDPKEVWEIETTFGPQSTFQIQYRNPIPLALLTTSKEVATLNPTCPNPLTPFIYSNPWGKTSDLHRSTLNRFRPVTWPRIPFIVHK